MQIPDCVNRPRGPWASRSWERRGKSRGRSGGASQLYAALDLGTNNCRLLIAEPTQAGGLRDGDRNSAVLRFVERRSASKATTLRFRCLFRPPRGWFS